MMRRLLTVMLAMTAIAMTAQTLHFHQLTVRDGLLHNNVITLAQDGKGHIWVATRAGLCCYDGHHLVTLPTENLPDKRIDRINRADDGTMWVQCFERHKQVSRYDTVTRRFVTYDVDALPDSVRRQAVQPLNRTFADPHSSRVWTIEKRQLWQTDTLKVNSQFAYTGKVAMDVGLKDEMFYTLLLDSQGILWVGSANNGLFFADTRMIRYRRLVCQPNPLVRMTFTDSHGTLWIAISDQKLLALPKKAAYTRQIDYPMTDSVLGRCVRAIAEDGKGRLWMGSHDGLYMKDAATGFQRIEMGGKEQVQVFCFCKEGDSWLWIGTNQGLFRLPLDERQPRAVLVDSTVTSIGKIATDKNRLWMATEKGLFCRVDSQTTQWYGDAVRAVVIDPTGQTWVGTDNGLMRVTARGIQHVSTPADGHTVKNLLCWRDFLWCSHEQGLCCINIYTGQSTILHTEHNEYLDGSASIDNHSGTIYFGGTAGIDCLQADSLDEKLRSGVAQLWLEEIAQTVSPQPEESAPTTWYYWALAALIAVGGAVIAYYFLRKPKAAVREEAEEPSAEPKPDSAFIQKARAITEAHMGDADFTAEQMAQEMAMSRSKLFLLMKKETGKAVMEFVRDIRLDYAAQQLAAGVPVADITMACGFSDPSSFRRSFVRKFGINPSQYREKMRQA